MTPEPHVARPRSMLWRWGFRLCVGAAFASLVLSLHSVAPVDRLLRAFAGVLLVAGGVHQSRVVTYDRLRRAGQPTLGFDSYLTRRQTGWSAIAVGALFLASAAVEW